MDKTIYIQSKVMGFDPKVINLVILVMYYVKPSTMFSDFDMCRIIDRMRSGL